MKKFIILIVVIVFIFTLSGCEHVNNISDEATTLTICVNEYDYGLTLKGVFDRFEAEHPEIEVVYELIPDSITENYTPEMRETAINRLRIQIMAGKGPDIYIDVMHPYSNGNEIDLLADIKLTMESGVFCDMTPYLESVGVNMDDFIAPIMVAGQIDGKQCIVPLHYDTYCIITNDYTWELLGGDNGFEDSFAITDNLLNLSHSTPEAFINTIQGYGLWYFGIEKAFNALNPFYFTVPDTMDYNTYTVNIDTPPVRELMEKGKTVYDNIMAAAQDFDAQKRFIPTEETAAEFESSIKNKPFCLVGRYLEYMLSTTGYMDSIGAGVHAVPARNVNGDVQALITMYAAVGANSEHKEEAAELIKLFLSEDMQNTTTYNEVSVWPVRKGLMANILCKYEGKGIPVYSSYHPNNTYFFDSSPSKEMISQFENIENSISSACFPIPVEARDILRDYYAGERDLDSAIIEMQEYMKKSLWAAS